MDVIPSFRDLDTTVELFEQFHKDMAKLDISVDMTYEDFCDTWINSGMLGDMNEYIMLPDEPCKSVGIDNVVVLPIDRATSLHAALSGQVWYEEEFKVYEPEGDYCKPTDSDSSWIDCYEGTTDDDDY